ncbi:unnamed protein product [Discosporangium mesarthrocarpum]
MKGHFLTVFSLSLCLPSALAFHVQAGHASRLPHSVTSLLAVRGLRCQKIELSCSVGDDQARGSISRTKLLETFAASAVGFIVSPRRVVAVGLPPRGPSKEELLERAKGTATEDDLQAAKKRRAEAAKERLEKQKKLTAERESRPTKESAEIDADLRANYYFPTARKRYLPRVKAVADEIGAIDGLISSGQWEEVSQFIEGTAEAARLPLTLYASSISGQGLSLDARYAKLMTAEAEKYGEELIKMRRAVAGKDTIKAREALSRLAESLSKYRVAGKIDTPDGGIGEISTVQRQGSGFSNNNANLYGKNNTKLNPKP